MDVDFTKVIKDHKGEVMKEAPTSQKQKLEDRDDLTLGSLVMDSLTAVALGEDGRPERMKAKESIRRTKLAERIYTAIEGPGGNCGVLNLNSEEIVLIKQRVEKTQLNPVIVAHAWDLIEPEEAEKDDKEKEATGV